jgi:hypothetical protein
MHRSHQQRVTFALSSLPQEAVVLDLPACRWLGLAGVRIERRRMPGRDPAKQQH